MGSAWVRFGDCVVERAKVQGVSSVYTAPGGPEQGVRLHLAGGSVVETSEEYRLEDVLYALGIDAVSI